MARNTNEQDDDNIDPSSVVSNVKSTFKQEIIKELLNGSFQDNKTKLGNDALTLVVEVAKCLVTETCLRASSQALRETCDKVDIEHVEKCLPQLPTQYTFRTQLAIRLHAVPADEPQPHYPIARHSRVRARFLQTYSLPPVTDDMNVTSPQSNVLSRGPSLPEASLG